MDHFPTSALASRSISGVGCGEDSLPTWDWDFCAFGVLTEALDPLSVLSCEPFATTEINTAADKKRLILIFASTMQRLITGSTQGPPCAGVYSARSVLVLGMIMRCP